MATAIATAASCFMRSSVVVPDLPPGNYQVWARGYGLIASNKSMSTPGRVVNITAIPARTPADAAQYYPAIYWYSMLKIPAAGDFNGHTPGIATDMTQTE